MANVFTKRSKMPRTTTLSDYGFRSKVEQAKAKENMEEMRLHSPTRRQNPQPIGLVYQSPYNRHNHVFGIWNPNQLMPVLRCGVTLPHLQSTNFSCAHHPDMLANYMIPANQGAPIQRKQPEVHYTRNTIQRQCFQWPPNIPEKFKGMVQSTRFGHSHRAPVVGIVPNAMPRAYASVRSYPEETRSSSDVNKATQKRPRLLSRPENKQQLTPSVPSRA
uniref:Uncharacterized LOC100179252 n=1 Tax=Ciona intestinalis TaxID=7719 RepID=A0A1W2WRA1_CIOIN|nr:uncharacterized protein LOC100179252 isoform X2 [Ciona intestinalis]|eukprot:XP_002131911.1 uncharacterized protein LOC100179252 isoform X2 [Ciona intestinalis]